MSGPARPRVFSGIQPSWALHIGNYLGAIRNWVRDQERYDNIFCIVDLHAMTSPYDAATLPDRVLELAATYLASGLTHENTTIFVQSKIAAHSELAWIIQCYTPIGWLERMTQFKDRISREGARERVGTGIFTYPALMAADILLYDTNFVPVGEDQRQHLEYTRDVAQRMNQRFGALFTIPEPLIREAGARIMGLDDPQSKMSKTVALSAPGHAVLLLDPPDVIRKKIARAQTDTRPEVSFPAGPGVTNLLEIYRTVRDLGWQSVEAEFGGKPYSQLKAMVADALIDVLNPIQRRYAELRRDEAELKRTLDRGAERLRPTAEATLQRVQKAVGLR
jgi:tryptophanyl-tRNA synthetase